MDPGTSIDVMLAEDHDGMRGALAQYLARLPGVRVVGEAADGVTAVRLAVDLRPTVLVLDVRLPGLDGVEVARQVREAAPDVRVLALSAHTNRQMIAAMAEAGALGYVAKSRAVQELAEALQTVAAGRRYENPAY